MAGLVPAIHDFGRDTSREKSWMLGTSAGHDRVKVKRLSLMEQELAIHEAEVTRRDQSPVRDSNAVERAVEIGIPEVEKVDEFGEARREVVVLPDIALQKLGMVGQAVEYFCCGQREALELASEGSVHLLSAAGPVLFRLFASS